MANKDKEQPKLDPFAVAPAEPVREVGPEDEVRDPSADAVDDDERSELEQLRAENDRLRALIAEGDARIRAAKPHEPSFGLSEGTRNDLELTGKAVSPFTGKQLDKNDL